MKDKSNVLFRCVFGLETAFVGIIPLVIWWLFTPTNILNSTPMFKLLELIGIVGSGMIPVAGIPVGAVGMVLGIMKAKAKKKSGIAMIVLSAINLIAAEFEIVMLIVLFCAVLFGGVSV